MKFNYAIFLISILFFPISLTAEGVSVILKSGDTLYKISRKYKISVNELISYNNIKKPENLKIGTIINIPSVYTVKKGDTLYGISVKYHLSVKELCTINKININHTLTIGERLKVPSALEKSSVTVAHTLPVETKKSTIKNNTSKNSFLWPHNGKRIAITGKLRGEEILGQKGDSIVSVSTGRVVWVAPYRGYGKLIMVETKDKLIFAYGGNEETLVNVGDFVKPGMQIGKMGIDPIEKNAKVYFFVYKEGKPVDPGKAPRG